MQIFVPVGSRWDFPEAETEQRFLERPLLAEGVKCGVKQNRRFGSAVVGEKKVTFLFSPRISRPMLQCHPVPGFMVQEIKRLH